MAKAKSAAKSAATEPDPGARAGAPPISEASDGGASRRTKGYEDNPVKPGETSVAQIEVLKD